MTCCIVTLFEAFEVRLAVVRLVLVVLLFLLRKVCRWTELCPKMYVQEACCR